MYNYRKHGTNEPTVTALVLKCSFVFSPIQRDGVEIKPGRFDLPVSRRVHLEDRTAATMHTTMFHIITGLGTSPLIKNHYVKPAQRFFR